MVLLLTHLLRYVYFSEITYGNRNERNMACHLEERSTAAIQLQIIPANSGPIDIIVVWSIVYYINVNVNDLKYLHSGLWVMAMGNWAWPTAYKTWIKALHVIPILCIWASYHMPKLINQVSIPYLQINVSKKRKHEIRWFIK